MSQGYYTWSRTAASNASADASINFAEGQAPSSINDSARAMMARTAEYRDDIAGAIVTAGTSTAYTVSSYQVFDTLAHMNGQMIAFTPHATNGATVTLNVDGLGAKPLRTSPNTELLAGMLIQGTPYAATYNNADGAFYLRDFYGNPYNIPLGGFLAYAGASAPNSSFVLPFGQAISRTIYSTLFSLVGSTYGAGDGSTTFNIPDLRGRGIFFADGMGGTPANRITAAGSGINAVNVSASGGAESHTLTTAELPVHSHANTLTDPGHAHLMYRTDQANVAVTGSTVVAANVTSSGTVQVATAAAFTSITINNANAGSGNAHSIMPPAYILNCIMRVI